jgi:recombination associated protein RdgC
VFKNVMVYRLGIDVLPTLEEMESALDAARFVDCGASQEMSAGWSAPRGQAHGALVESVAGQRILKYTIETKAVPSTVVRRKADEAAAHIEATTGRKPGKKELRDLREDAKHALLPQAFSKVSSVWIWLAPEVDLLILDAGSQSRADAVVTALVNAVPGMAPRLFNTQQTPQSAMAQWLSEGEAVGGFQLERECELKSSAEDRAVVKYARHTLDIDEVKQHIAQGKLPTRVALNWQGRVAFTLTEAMTLKKLGLLETVFEGTSKEKEDNFDADVAITTGELSQLLPELIEALGGEMAEFAAAGTDPSVAPPPGSGTVTTGTGHANAALATAEGDDSAPF